MSLIKDSAAKESFENQEEITQTDEEELLASFKDLQAVNIDELILASNFESLNRYLDCINKTTIAAAEKINQLTIEEAKLDQQLGIFEEKSERPEIEEALENYKCNFNRNCLELQNINSQTEMISNMQVKGCTATTADVIYRGKYKAKIEFAEEGWKKLSGIRMISPVEIETEQFKECVQECLGKDDLVPLWGYMCKHFN